MKARPILMSAPMVRALLAGTKMQTRRICKPQPHSVGDHFSTRSHGTLMIRTPGEEAWKPVPCPYGVPGDLLWVRETWAHYQTVNHVRRQHGGALDEISDGLAAYRADGHESIEDLRTHIRLMSGHDLQAIEIRGDAWRPSIHMPRWASRLTLRLTDVRVERLQEISGPDCWAEGIEHAGWDCEKYGSVTHCYRDLWESINGPGSWAANPWVWALSFEVIQANVDQVVTA